MLSAAAPPPKEPTGGLLFLCRVRSRRTPSFVRARDNGLPVEIGRRQTIRDGLPLLLYAFDFRLSLDFSCAAALITNAPWATSRKVEQKFQLWATKRLVFHYGACLINGAFQDGNEPSSSQGRPLFSLETCSSLPCMRFLMSSDFPLPWLAISLFLLLQHRTSRTGLIPLAKLVIIECASSFAACCTGPLIDPPFPLEEEIASPEAGRFRFLPKENGPYLFPF